MNPGEIIDGEFTEKELIPEIETEVTPEIEPEEDPEILEGITADEDVPADEEQPE
jgi:hypothetical protein